MFIFIATDGLRRGTTSAAAAFLKTSGRNGAPTPATTPPSPIASATPAGTRYQLLRALREMAKGEAMLVERRIPSLMEHIENGGKRESWLSSLRPATSWLDTTDIEPIIVPGTAFPGLIGRILLHNGWSAPSGTPHWVPNLRLFNLSALGHQAFADTQAWWQTLTPIQRLRIILAE